MAMVLRYWEFKTFALILICALICVIAAYVGGRVRGAYLARIECIEAQAEAQKAADRQSALMRAGLENALSESYEKQEQILRDFGSYVSANQRLRVVATADVPECSPAAKVIAEKRGELLARCGEEYGAMARRADEHAENARMIWQAWQNIFLVTQGGSKRKD